MAQYAMYAPPAHLVTIYGMVGYRTPMTDILRKQGEHLRGNAELCDLDAARQETRHAEVITQTRLYNFLFCASILILAWATLFSTSSGDHAIACKRHWALISLSVFNFGASIMYALLGWRAKRVIDIRYDIELFLEGRLLETQLRLAEPIRRLQQNRKQGHQARSELYKTAYKNKCGMIGVSFPTPSSSYLLWVIPLAFAAFSAILVSLSFSN